MKQAYGVESLLYELLGVGMLPYLLPVFERFVINSRNADCTALLLTNVGISRDQPTDEYSREYFFIVNLSTPLSPPYIYIKTMAGPKVLLEKIKLMPYICISPGSNVTLFIVFCCFENYYLYDSSSMLLLPRVLLPLMAS